MAGPAGKPGPHGTIIPTTRMAPRLAPRPRPTPTPADRKLKAKVAVLAKKKPVQIVARGPRVDDQFKARVTFSPAYGDGAGETWSEPLQIDDPVAAAGQEFYWRCDIDQFRVDPLLQGFATTWTCLTSGWTFVDGLGATIYDEAISNPLIICRVVKAPATISVSPRFKVVVTKKYLP
jgi:hypothetical protein